ncbi:sensor histidine kinase [Aliarcobacter butzleri]|uniref:sensor histidine kinase n=1 Tax=Aliarcobacter butzleri TaxID=28197 RepID=UPI0021B6C3A9|nr:sensor histidine kinase [Aliarcobacter butzleri]MCT7642620.1 ATP-binding protein [Aliarcobacter butzleri]
MKLIRIQRFLNKTDLGLSGKNGCEILLSKKIENYFEHILKDEVIDVINIEDQSKILLTKKIERSTKFTNQDLKNYFLKYEIEEGDILEFYILEDKNNYSYFLNFIKNSYLIFKLNKSINEYYSLSSSKLEKYFEIHNPQNEIYSDSNNEIKGFIKTSFNKLRSDGIEEIQHYKFIPNHIYNIFLLNPETMRISEINDINNDEILINQKDIDMSNRYYELLEKLLNLTNKNSKYQEIETSFKPKSRLLLQLGDQLIKNEKIALSEIIKNSYDACSRNVKVIMNDIDNLDLGEIIIYDDGCGMDLNILNNVWMEPGTNYKENKDDKTYINKCNRRPIGEKGIGRFGVHKLGNYIQLISKKENSNEVYFEINWDDFNEDGYLADKLITIKERKPTFFNQDETGTYIRITKLRKLWNKKDFRELYRSSFSLTSPFESRDDFDINIETNLDDWKEGLLSLDKVRQYGLWYFECSANQIKDEKNNDISKITNFKYKFQPYRYMDKAESREITHEDPYIKINPFIKKEIDKEKQEKDKDKFEFISFDGIGEVTIKGYIFDFDKDTLDLSDISDRKGLRDFVKQNGGVRVYRDGMRIYDYGELGNDWLNMDSSRINAPTSKIANRNIISSIFIDGKESKKLIEKTNREGFIENEIYYNFKDIIINILNKVNFLRNEDKDKFRKQYTKEKDSNQDTLAVIQKTKEQIVQYIKEEEHQIKVLHSIEKIENNYNSLKDIVLKSSGTGLAYSLVMHEIEKMVDNLKNTISLKKEYESISETVLHLSKSIESISSLLNNDKIDSISLTKIAIKAIVFFRRRLKKHKIDLIINFDDKKDIFTKCLNNLTVNAIMNLIDNSAYWLKYNYDLLENRKILIDIIEKEKSIELIVSDTGLGFSISEDTAVLPFKTTKQEGYGKGLGLYFVQSIMEQNGGQFKIITNADYKTNNLKLPKEFIKGATVALEFMKVENESN